MAFVLLRLFYGIYFLGSAIILYHLVSVLLFKKDGLKNDWGIKLALLLFFWPLAIFSKEGRQQLCELRRKIIG